MMRLAEEKKTSVRKTITDMQKKFRLLLDKNEQLPEHLRLDRKVSGIVDFRKSTGLMTLAKIAYDRVEHLDTDPVVLHLNRHKTSV